MSDHQRRRFLQFLLASPVLPLLGACRDKSSSLASSLPADARAADAIEQALISSPQDALDLFDLAAVGERNIPPAHWGSLMSGSDDDRTMQLNSEAFARLQIRARRFVDTSKVDASIELLGSKLTSPIVLSPLSGQEAYHPEGEVGTATAARKRGHLMTLSSFASRSLASVADAIGDRSKLWFQCYPTDQLAVALDVIKRAEDLGIKTLILTADMPARGNRISLIRSARKDPRPCESCHGDNPGSTKPRNPQVFLRSFPMYEGLELGQVTSFLRPITLDFIGKVRAATRMKIAVKGIVTAEDARICVDHGIDAVWVSNHGGRQENSGVATIETLQEVVTAVAGKLPIVFDGGVRRGTDVFKALALGATAVGIGRPQAWALGAFGAAGVERALELLQLELTKTMQIVGTPSIAAITPAHVRWR
ncbi:MAG: lldD 1 [Myxococcales bacterium]|nr:lldD 1 [Myxococcales bacterium]